MLDPKRPMTRRQTTIIIALSAMFSSLVVYPVVHEGGHYLMARAFGIEVHDVVWTILTGQAPHVSLGTTPGDVLSWVNAGGMLLPTLVGGTLMIVWLLYAKRWASGIRLALAIPGVVLLAGNAGLLLELLQEPTLLHHMQPLALHLGLSGIASVLLQAAPAVVSVVLLWFSARTFLMLQRSEQ